MVCHLAGFSPRHCVTPTSPQSDWAELIQLPSILKFARLTWHHAGPTNNQIAFTRPGSSSQQELNRAKQHRTGSKAESRAKLSHIHLHISLSPHPCPDSGEQCRPHWDHQLSNCIGAQNVLVSSAKFCCQHRSTLPPLYKQNIPFAPKNCVDLVANSFQ